MAVLRLLGPVCNPHPVAVLEEDIASAMSPQAAESQPRSQDAPRTYRSVEPRTVRKKSGAERARDAGGCARITRRGGTAARSSAVQTKTLRPKQKRASRWRPL